MLFFFPRGVLDEILNLIESVSEGFLSYFLKKKKTINTSIKGGRGPAKLAAGTKYICVDIFSVFRYFLFVVIFFSSPEP